MSGLKFGSLQVWHTEKSCSIDGKDHWSIMRRDRPSPDERKLGVSCRWERVAGPFDTEKEAEDAWEEMEGKE